jgi:hypothetical protein
MKPFIYLLTLALAHGAFSDETCENRICSKVKVTANNYGNAESVTVGVVLHRKRWISWTDGPWFPTCITPRCIPMDGDPAFAFVAAKKN